MIRIWDKYYRYQHPTYLIQLHPRKLIPIPKYIQIQVRAFNAWTQAYCLQQYMSLPTTVQQVKKVVLPICSRSQSPRSREISPSPGSVYGHAWWSPGTKGIMTFHPIFIILHASWPLATITLHLKVHTDDRIIRNPGQVQGAWARVQQPYSVGTLYRESGKLEENLLCQRKS